MSEELTSVLEMAADAAQKAANGIPAPYNVVSSIAAVALRAGAAFARAGKDPLAEITRVLDASKPVEEVHNDWNTLLNNKFGRPDSPPDTEPSGVELLSTDLPPNSEE